MNVRIKGLSFKNECGVYDNVTIELMQEFVDSAVKSGATHFDLRKRENKTQTGIALGKHEVILTAYREQTELELLQNKRDILEEEVKMLDAKIAEIVNHT